MPRLADLVLQSHHLNQWLAKKNEASAGRVSSGTVQQESSAGMTTTSNVAEEAGGDRIFVSVREEQGESTSSEGVDYPSKILFRCTVENFQHSNFFVTM